MIVLIQQFLNWYHGISVTSTIVCACKQMEQSRGNGKIFNRLDKCVSFFATFRVSLELLKMHDNLSNLCYYKACQNFIPPFSPTFQLKEELFWLKEMFNLVIALSKWPRFLSKEILLPSTFWPRKMIWCIWSLLTITLKVFCRSYKWMRQVITKFFFKCKCRII